MVDERMFVLDVSEKDYDEISSPFIVIPPGPTGVEAEGDSITLAVEAGMADWKQPGVSLKVPLVVTAEGINNGKKADWYPGVSKGAMGITKQALQAFGIEDAVIKRVKGKIAIAPSAFAGAQAIATFKREMSNKGNLRSVLDSTKFYPVGSVSTPSEEESLL